MNISIHIDVYIHICTYILICILIYLCIHLYIHIHMHVYIQPLYSLFDIFQRSLAFWCINLFHNAKRLHVLQHVVKDCVAVCCSVLQCVAVCCINCQPCTTQRGCVCCSMLKDMEEFCISVLQLSSLHTGKDCVCCSILWRVLQYVVKGVAVCCSVMQHIPHNTYHTTQPPFSLRHIHTHTYTRTHTHTHTYTHTPHNTHHKDSFRESCVLQH